MKEKETTADFAKFKQKLMELTHLSVVLTLLDWDLNVNMPPKAAEKRAQTNAYIIGLYHEKFLSKDFERLLRRLNNAKLKPDQAAIIREVYRDFEKEKKLPAKFLEELALVTTQAHHAWIEARKESNFAKFAPHLKKIVKLKRQQAALLGFKKSPYDALLDYFEPDLTSAECSIIFEELRIFLVPLLAQIKKSKVKINSELLKGKFSIAAQKEFNQQVISKLGFDLNAGRVDISAHPFATGVYPTDVRITTRFNENNLLESLTGLIHESGHGMYEQGLNEQYFGTPLGASLSLGIHESQSRLWENLVGRGKHAWKYFFPLLLQKFPELKKVKFEDFYKVLNQVKPSLIRTEADEVTYNLHIIIRFEIEKALIEGTIEVDDLPKIWNQKYEEYLGVKVPNDASGVLQDVHWSGGGIGYFPSYTLGNLNSVQFYRAAKKSNKNLEKEFEKGNFSSLKKWLNKNVHIHGRFYSSSELMQKTTGEPLNIDYYKEYLHKKYSEIYNLK